MKNEGKAIAPAVLGVVLGVLGFHTVFFTAVAVIIIYAVTVLVITDPDM